MFLASDGLPLSFALPASPLSPRSVPGDVVRWSTSVRAAAAALPHGPSLQTGLFCPAHPHLRPHAPHSQAPPDFTAQRLIRNALATRALHRLEGEVYREKYLVPRDFHMSVNSPGPLSDFD